MKLLSVNCGLPREVLWHGTRVTTSIFKEPVEGRIALRTLNLEGDRQSDLSVHGGKNKAVYFYSIEHYGYWKEELPGMPLPLGAFGENFTVEGFLEDAVCVGDRITVGSAELVVTQPRLPCYKLGIRFGSDDMIARFLASGRTGFYVAVLREGEVGAGDEVTVVGQAADPVPVSEVTRLYVAKEFDAEDVRQVRRLMAAKALTDSWKSYFEEKLERQESGIRDEGAEERNNGCDSS
jgi:MOSC domain-containing protein YiiM